MAEYTSRFSELAFFVEGKLYKFNGGRFSTDEKEVIEVVERLSDVVRVDEVEKVEVKSEEKPKATRKTAKSKTSEK